jgi:hypothetical protein
MTWCLVLLLLYFSGLIVLLARQIVYENVLVLYTYYTRHLTLFAMLFLTSQLSSRRHNNNHRQSHAIFVFYSSRHKRQTQHPKQGYRPSHRYFRSIFFKPLRSRRLLRSLVVFGGPSIRRVREILTVGNCQSIRLILNRLDVLPSATQPLLPQRDAVVARADGQNVAAQAPTSPPGDVVESWESDVCPVA